MEPKISSILKTNVRDNVQLNRMLLSSDPLDPFRLQLTGSSLHFAKIPLSWETEPARLFSPSSHLGRQAAAAARHSKANVFLMFMGDALERKTCLTQRIIVRKHAIQTLMMIHSKLLMSAVLTLIRVLAEWARKCLLSTRRPKDAKNSYMEVRPQPKKGQCQCGSHFFFHIRC